MASFLYFDGFELNEYLWISFTWLLFNETVTDLKLTLHRGACRDTIVAHAYKFLTRLEWMI